MSAHIKYRAGYKYQLAEDYIHPLPFPLPDIHTPHEFLEVSGSILTIRQGYAWDGPSGPTVDTANFMRGSLVHDALYQLMRDRYLDPDQYKGQADRELARICSEDGMSWFRCHYVYLGVRVGGHDGAYNSHQNPIITAP